MPVFSFSAAERNGSVHRGERESDSEKFLAQSLKAEGLFLLEAREKKGISSINLKDLLDRLRPVRIVERMVFTRNLGVMIAAGLSLTKALEALAHQTANLKFRKIIEDVDNGVVHGKSFADALRSHEKVFGVLFINMIELVAAGRDEQAVGAERPRRPHFSDGVRKVQSRGAKSEGAESKRAAGACGHRISRKKRTVIIALQTGGHSARDAECEES